MKRILALTAAGLSAAAALATDGLSAATETGTIQPTGPRQPPNGDRFFNVQGADALANASYGVARWDLTAARAAFDTEFGAGNWFIGGIDLRLTHDSAAFTVAGPVRVFHTTDDTTDIKTPASPLVYPLEDSPGVTDLPVVLADPLVTYTFNGTPGSTGTVDSYALFRLGNGGQRAVLAADVTGSNALTLVLVENNTSVSATYSGQLPDAGRQAPELRIRAVANGGNVAPYANAGADQTAEDLNGDGFELFTLNGTGSQDVDGTISSYIWREGATQVASGATPANVSFAVGTHTITLTVTDNGGATDTDTVIINVSAGPRPTAQAGANIDVTDANNSGAENVVLDGSGSSDVDGTIANYEWREGATVLGSGPNPTLNVSLSVGSHTIRLIVTDDDTQTDIDFVQVDVRPGNIVGGHDFDFLQSYLSFTAVPDTLSTPFTSPADGFGLFQRFVSASIPFSLADDTVASFPTDNLGIVKSKKLDGWFGVNDLNNPDNTTGLGTVTWTFDIAGDSSIQVRVDMAAMGDFEFPTTPSDTFVWSYSIDGGAFTDIFTCVADEAQDGIQYELESGRLPALINDPLVVNGTTRLSNNFQTLVANVTGSGNVLTLRLAVQQDSDEPYVFDNVFITAPNAPTGCPQPGCDSGGIDADNDNDCDVDLQDLANVLAQFGVLVGASADTDGDGDVDLQDLANVLGRFGNICQ